MQRILNSPKIIILHKEGKEDMSFGDFMEGRSFALTCMILQNMRMRFGSIARDNSDHNKPLIRISQMPSIPSGRKAKKISPSTTDVTLSLKVSQEHIHFHLNHVLHITIPIL